jgi:hypothetical protein
MDDAGIGMHNEAISIKPNISDMADLNSAVHRLDVFQLLLENFLSAPIFEVLRFLHFAI